MDKQKREDIEQFKRDLYSYKNHKHSIERLKNKLLELETRLENVKSPRFEAVPVHTKSSEGDMRLELIEEKGKVVKKLELYQNIVNEIEGKLNKATKEERDILVLVYVEHVPIRKIARVYYKSVSTMYRDINKMIAKII